MITPRAPRIVDPAEAHEHFARARTIDLAHTIATEPDRIRAAVVKALRAAGSDQTMWSAEPGEWLMERADDIANGADF